MSQSNSAKIKLTCKGREEKLKEMRRRVEYKVTEHPEVLIGLASVKIFREEPCKMLSRPAVPDPRDYDIHFETGFAPADPTELPTYYSPWCELISDLPTLLEAQALRKKVHSLELLTTHHLTSLAQWQRAYVILGFLTQAYVWQDKKYPAPTVPACLGEPYLDVCKSLGMEPALSYAGLCLWNWLPVNQMEVSNPSQILAQFSNVKAYASFTGTRDEDAFYLVPVMIEVQAGRLIGAVLDAIKADQKHEPQDLASILETCTATLRSMGETLSVLHQNCDPMTFYQLIRPMIAGSGGAEDKGLPNGVAFQRHDGSELVGKCVGGSAGQSSLFQFLDHVLGVEHESKMLVEMRSYMSKHHRDFLEAVEQLPSLLDIVDRHSERESLLDTFRLLREALQQWRTKHVVIVSRYIVQPAAKEAKYKSAVEPKGTGGSLPVPFLKQYRDETTLKVDE